MASREEMDLLLRGMSQDDQYWLFRQLVDRFWPELAGKKVRLIEATSEDDGYTEEDYEWYRRKAEDADRLWEKGI